MFRQPAISGKINHRLYLYENDALEIAQLRFQSPSILYITGKIAGTCMGLHKEENVATLGGLGYLSPRYILE